LVIEHQTPAHGFSLLKIRYLSGFELPENKKLLVKSSVIESDELKV